MPIVGTAGHVDHGKSALVAALTGTNPDRWLEEQLRGMTLDLGFARLAIGDGIEAGVIDVPGHERFLRNMLAGAAGMDVLLLTVAADEGVMPQTREHLDVLRFLNVRETIVVVTKIDLIPHELRAQTQTSIVDALHDTLAAGAPVACVSSLTGEGLDELRGLIAQAVRALPPPASAAPVYLPVDRVFALPGIGTIVTGTLMQGSVAEGDTLALEPSGRRARVRRIEVFAARQARVEAGSRVALNLAGIDRHDVARGEAVASPEFQARRRFVVRFTPLRDALPLLRKRVAVRAYVGAAEILGTLTFERPPDRAAEVRAELHLQRPALAFPGVRFVVRRLSPKTLLGGGSIEGVATGEDVDARAPAENAVAAVLRSRGLEAVESGDVAFGANLREDAAREALEALAARDEVLELHRPTAYVDGAAAAELLQRIDAFLEDAQKAEPWALGVTSIALARALGVPEPLLVRVLTAMTESGRLSGRAGYYATLDHRPSITPEQRAFFDELVPVDAARPCLPVPYAGVVAAVRRAAVPGAGKAFDTLLARGVLVRVGADLYRGSQIAAIRSRVEVYLRRNHRMTPAQFRDEIGSSRKYAVPLLEWLDSSGFTLRNGDHRTLRRPT
ncbi:MAG TPA: selenocysteine-specific translation elongation factor [Candidatus Tumulicola sp.]|nr:selenocysteine-specific translation elongation factor [Candidatus Tumulicola sp.]